MAKILSIEDDEFLRELIGAHLRNAGHQVVTCADGAEAIRSILAERPDLVLLDLNMPYLDGFELLKALRGDALTRELPVIVLSGRTDHASQSRVLEMGGSDYLTKPILVENLLASVKRRLGSRPA